MMVWRVRVRQATSENKGFADTNTFIHVRVTILEKMLTVIAHKKVHFDGSGPGHIGRQYEYTQVKIHNIHLLNVI